MNPTEIAGSKYRLWFEPKINTVHLEGSLRLSSDQYKPIATFLNDALAECAGKTIVLNLCELKFLNSSGINTLYKFAIALRKNDATGLEVRGSKSVLWQSKSLSNIKRFYPESTLTMV